MMIPLHVDNDPRMRLDRSTFDKPLHEIQRGAYLWNFGEHGHIAKL